MLNARIPISKLPAQMHKLRVAIKHGMRKGIEASAQQTVKILRQATLSAPAASPNGRVGAYNTSALYHGWHVAWQRENTVAFVRNTKRYADFVEFGRSPGSHVPPISAIYAWVLKRFGGGAAQRANPTRYSSPTAPADYAREKVTQQAKSGLTKPKKTKTLKVRAKNAEQAAMLRLAWAISKAIARRGLWGRYILGTSFPRIVELHQKNVDREIQKALKAVVR